jgi:hypothetical protein
MALNDLYELTLETRLYSQVCYNVFFYHQALAFVTTYPTISQVLNENWIAQRLPAVQAVLAGDVNLTGVRVRNLYDNADAYEASISGVGGATQVGSDTLPSFAAYGFSLGPQEPSVRPGSKRFVGVAEAAQSDGIITNGDFVTILQALEDDLIEPVTVGTVIQDDVFLPVVVKRIREGTPGSYTYRLPNNSLEGVFSQIVVAAFNALVTSQVSRKVGVGL